MKLSNRILTILLMAVFLAMPAMAGEGNSNLNTRSGFIANSGGGGMIPDPRSTLYAVLGSGGGATPDPKSAQQGRNGILASGGGDGATPDPQSMEVLCILGYCFSH
ncbi:hypothetical protein KIH87_07300 [Paraneptunicella aestuarii]|uniref:hypothetical protein n=1 Tax=Paraneptunicella aestuarii TaxID=2831148 RepID=UPI001E49145F|nr:hypothetical protein [Paraneptunicella aestuarii]UAA40144.1 hypothetical protein KIH87_07300 [Paraneptunicella aestuarii]